MLNKLLLNRTLVHRISPILQTHTFRAASSKFDKAGAWSDLGTKDSKTKGHLGFLKNVNGRNQDNQRRSEKQIEKERRQEIEQAKESLKYIE